MEAAETEAQASQSVGAAACREAHSFKGAVRKEAPEANEEAPEANEEAPEASEEAPAKAR